MASMAKIFYLTLKQQILFSLREFARAVKIAQKQAFAVFGCLNILMRARAIFLT